MSYLFKGSKGEQVRQIQQALNRAGANLNPDGVYGAMTEAAVREFQTKHHLKSDGLVGPDTMEALAPYMVDYSIITRAVEDCLDALEQLPEYKKLEALLYG